ncbi:DUF192 domain-containing protein [Endobacterium cereale]|uniref:DUF192 domain-containing protein n=1 Tax=Endobacterium cereale TaxID=2663029 RepID=UPI002B46F881|nr:DUF192 domain-containing protein [Endobacterium cereale]MEB2843702.1 DUF192 domain-containing protein [Endobacterium cereale]
MRAAVSTLFVSAVLALSLFVASAVAAPVRFETEPLTIESVGGKQHRFTVELALDDAQREQGLMLRREMAPDSGMLFDFGLVRDVSMWMHNTLIPLDMLFIDASGRITHIHDSAEPQSDAIISSRGPIKYVLELNGGRSKVLGIKAGDVVRSGQIGNSK